MSTLSMNEIAARSTSSLCVEHLSKLDERTRLEVGRLRLDAWRVQVPSVDANFPEGNWLDEHDERGTHLVVRREARIVASARLCIYDRLRDCHPSLAHYERAVEGTPIAYMSRLVVHPDARGLGLSAKLDAARAELARALGAATLVVCWSSFTPRSRLDALVANGFRPFANYADTPFDENEEFAWLMKSL